MPACSTVPTSTPVRSRGDFERAWQHEDDAPRHARITPETAILVSRNSPNDFQDRQIYVWIDGSRWARSATATPSARPIEPGRHSSACSIRCSRERLTVDAAPGEQVRVQCGTGMPTAGWLMMIFLHVTYLRVWVDA